MITEKNKKLKKVVECSCGHVWTYKGNHINVTCPSCRKIVDRSKQK